MSAPFRLPLGGRVERDTPLRFTFDGREYTGLRGDTLASALLANGVHAVARSINHDRPRGIFSAGVEEPNALVQLEAPRCEPMLTATTVELVDDLEARSIEVLLAQVKSSVRDRLRRTGLLARIGEDRIYLSIGSAVTDFGRRHPIGDAQAAQGAEP